MIDWPGLGGAPCPVFFGQLIYLGRCEGMSVNFIRLGIAGSWQESPEALNREPRQHGLGNSVKVGKERKRNYYTE